MLSMGRLIGFRPQFFNQSGRLSGRAGLPPAARLAIGAAMSVRLASSIFLLALAAPAAAIPIELSGTARTRAEAVAGQIRPGFDRSELLLNSRLTLRADVGDGPVTLVGELWDSRAFAVSNGSVIGTNEVNVLEPVQAYLEARVDPKLQLTVGRMLLNVGSRRLIAADDYRNTTNGYTGVKLDLGTAKGANATLVAMLPQQRRPDDFARVRRNAFELDRDGFDQQLYGAVAALPGAFGDTMVEASLVRFAERDTRTRATRDRRLWTLGGRLLRAPAAGKLDYELEGFYQTGRIGASTAPAAPSLDVAAWFVHAELGHSPAPTSRLALELDIASGDDRGATYRRFDTLFGMRRADLAPAGLYNVVGRANIVALGPRVEVAPSKATDGFLTWKLLWAQSASDSFSTSGVRDPSGGSGRFAGQQLDARLRQKLTRALRAELNMTVLRREGLLVDAPNAPPGRTMAYGSLAVSAGF
jgi:hypothetical protein